MTLLRRLTTAAAAAGLLAFAAPALAADNAPEVQIGPTGFTPAAVTIAAGGSVSWVNRDNVNHQLNSPAVKLVSPTLTPTDSFSFTFPTPGTYTVADAAGPSMTVTVREAPLVTVHLSLQPKAVVFGGTLKVRGNLDPGQSGQPVTIQVKQCGSQGFAAAKRVQTGAGGAFAASVKPRGNSVYQVVAGNSKATVAAHVSPRLSLRKLGAGRYLLRVGGPATGDHVSIQMRVGSRWKIVTTVTVRGASKTLRLGVAPGTRLRASMSSQQAGQCLDAGVSKAIAA